MPPVPHAEHDTAAGLPARRRARMRSAYEQRQRRRRVISYALFGAALVLMVNSLIGEHGYLATVRVSREHQRLVADLNALRTENQSLLDRLQRIRTDPAALEEAAREELGLIKPGETLYILKDRVPAQAPAPR